MADPAATAAGATALASTYMAKYTTETDVLGGEYGPMYDRYNSAVDGDQLQRAMLQSSNVIPKVYLCLVEVNGKPTISAFHRPSTYQAHPIQATEWDGQSFIFRGDVMPGNHIPMVRLPNDAFDRTEEQRVPTIAAMDGLLGVLPLNEDYLLTSTRGWSRRYGACLPTGTTSKSSPE